MPFGRKTEVKTMIEISAIGIMISAAVMAALIAAMYWSPNFANGRRYEGSSEESRTPVGELRIDLYKLSLDELRVLDHGLRGTEYGRTVHEARAIRVMEAKKKHDEEFAKTRRMRRELGERVQGLDVRSLSPSQLEGLLSLLE